MTTPPPQIPSPDGGDRPVVRQVVLDCPHPRALASFYQSLLGYDYRPGDEPPPPGEPDPRGEDWLVLRPVADDPAGGRGIAFQASPDHVPPVWSAGAESAAPGAQRQMLHLDMSVSGPASLQRQRDRAVQLGATILLDRFDDDQEPLCVFADPAGHPFCIFVG